MLRLLALALLTLPVAAQADTSLHCSAEGISAQIEVSETSASSVLKLDGEEVPALRGCMIFASGNHSMPHKNRMGGKWRCPHGVAGSQMRYEVYPIVDKFNGEANHVKVIIWNGTSPSTVDLKDCE